eukprot:gb/GECH01007276.1/.p1 GENE.gb/GECH01007276.1/~~gb/GECH01007276.1/.p1  ORF type:complete len:1157 (+),score=382.43 gb/GECH01007276.1/:1-3471(+)
MKVIVKYEENKKPFTVDMNTTFISQLEEICNLFDLDVSKYTLYIQDMWGNDVYINPDIAYIRPQYFYEENQIVELVERPSIKAQKVINNLESEKESNMRQALTHLKTQLQQEGFAEEFIQNKGILVLASLIHKTKGNIQGYLLGALRDGLSYVSGMNAVMESPQIIKEIYQVTGIEVHNTTVYKNALEILIVICSYVEDGFKMIHETAKGYSSHLGEEAYHNFIDLLNNNDLDVQLKTLTLMNLMAKKAQTDRKQKRLVFYWKKAGIIDLIRDKESNHLETKLPEIQTQIDLLQNISGCTIPGSWFQAREFEKKYEEEMKKYQRACDEIFKFQQQQPLVKILKEELLRCYDTLTAASSFSGDHSQLTPPKARQVRNRTDDLDKSDSSDFSQKDHSIEDITFISFAGFDMGESSAYSSLKVDEIRKNMVSQLLEHKDYSTVTMEAVKQAGFEVPKTKTDELFDSSDEEDETEEIAIQTEDEVVTGSRGYSFGKEEEVDEKIDNRIADTRRGGKEMPVKKQIKHGKPQEFENWQEDEKEENNRKESRQTKEVASPTQRGGDVPPPQRSEKESSLPASVTGSESLVSPPKSDQGQGLPPPALSNNEDGVPPHSGGKDGTPPLPNSGVNSSPPPSGEGKATTPGEGKEPPLPPKSEKESSLPPPPPPSGSDSLPPPPKSDRDQELPPPPSSNQEGGLPPPPGGKDGPPPPPSSGMAPPPPPPGGGKSPPPPPPGKGGVPPPLPSGGGNGPVKPKSKPKRKMKNLHWSKLKLSSDNKTIWSKLPNEIDFNEEEFCEKFSVKEKKRAVKKIAQKKQEEPSLLEGKLHNNISIMLHKLPNVAEIQSAVLNIDNNILSKENLSNMIQNIPSREAIGDFAKKMSKKENLSEPEKFVSMTIMIPEFTDRIRCWLFSMEFSESLQNLERPILQLEGGCKAINDSRQLPIILAYVLEFGNYMNQGTPRGEAKGFALDILPKLDVTKDKDNKQSLLKYLINTVRWNQPQALDVANELSDVHTAAKLKFETTDNLVSEASNSLKKFKGQMKNISKNMDKEDPFMKKMTPFYVNAKESLRQVETRYNEIKDEYKSLLTYFGFPPRALKKPSVDDLFGVLSRFLKGCEKYLKSSEKKRNKAAKHGGRIIKGVSGDLMTAMVQSITEDLTKSE